MNRNQRQINCQSHQSGVTLIELVLLITLSGIIVIPLANGLTSVGKSLIINNETLTANTLVQACAEHLWYQRRFPNTSVAITDCNIIPGFTALGNLSIVVFTAGTAPCPTGTFNPSSCETITISANNNDAIERASLQLFFIYP